MEIAIEWCLKRSKRRRTLPADSSWNLLWCASGKRRSTVSASSESFANTPFIHIFSRNLLLFCYVHINYWNDHVRRRCSTARTSHERLFYQDSSTVESPTIRQPRIMLIDQIRYGSNSCFAANYSVYNQESTKNVRGEHSFELFLWLNAELFAQSREKESFQA